MTPQEFFKKDLFAEQTGVELLEVREGYSKARLVITENHLNAGHRTQGGAIFTLADLALAAAANSHGTLAFSLSSNITFLRASGPGDTLYADGDQVAVIRREAGKPVMYWLEGTLDLRLVRGADGRVAKLRLELAGTTREAMPLR